MIIYFYIDIEYVVLDIQGSRRACLTPSTSLTSPHPIYKTGKPARRVDKRAAEDSHFIGTARSHSLKAHILYTLWFCITPGVPQALCRPSILRKTLSPREKNPHNHLHTPSPGEKTPCDGQPGIPSCSGYIFTSPRFNPMPCHACVSHMTASITALPRLRTHNPAPG